MKAIIFDFGNVVGFFDHTPAFEKLRPFTSYTAEEMYALVYAGELEDRFERGQMTRDEFLSQAKTLWKLACEHDFIEAALADIFRVNPEVCELIPKLKRRYRILLGSNTNPIHSKQFLAQFADVLGQFDDLVLSHDIGARKPHADFFLHCQRLAQAPASECVFIDDLPENIAGARAIGMHGIVYTPQVNLEKELRALGVAF